MVLATQTLLQRQPKTYEVRVDGRLTAGRQREGHHPRADRPHRHRRRHRPRLRVPRRRHPRANMEQRMTICNMSIEGGARAGLSRPTTRPSTTSTAAATPRRARPGTRPSPRWRTLPTDDGADVRQVDHDRRDAPRADGHLRQQPGHGHARSRGRVPAPRTPRTAQARRGLERALEYMDLSRASRSPATRSTSCSSAAAPTAGSATCASRRASSRTATSPTASRLMVVPGSQQVKRQAEREGLARDLPRRRRRVARGRLLDVHRDERRPADARPVRDQHLATATSRAARARAAGRSSPAR